MSPLEQVILRLNQEYHLGLNPTSIKLKAYDLKTAGFSSNPTQEEIKRVAKALTGHDQGNPVLKTASSEEPVQVSSSSVCPRCQSKMIEAMLTGGENVVVCPACRVVDLA